MARRNGGTRRARSALAVMWILGACSQGPGPTGLSNQRTVDDATSMTVAGGLNQSAAVGRPLPIAAAVRVTDDGGRGVAGVLVSFDPDPGSGTVSRRVVQSAVDGRAEVTWTLGPASGPQSLRARALGLPTVIFGATATAAADPGRFDIEIRLDPSSGTPNQRRAFDDAKRRWESVLVGDLADIAIQRTAGFCGATAALDETVDDLLILAEIESIDGPGGVLGSAGPCLIRFGSDLPVLGQMTFDADDLDRLEASGTLEDVIVHEMGHVLGIGSLWDLFGLIADASRPDSTRADPHFVGGGALQAFEVVGGGAYSGSKVPIEDTGGPGTRLSHWRDRVFETELMTGFINRGLNPLSIVTVTSLEDMGYEVDLSAADAYRLQATGSGGSGSRVPARGDVIELGDDVRDEPIFTIDDHGRVRPLRPR